MNTEFTSFLRQHITASVFWKVEEQLFSEQTEHLPFVFWLIENLQPKSIVQLGAHDPNFYFGYCYAVKKLLLDTCCYIVDFLDGEQATKSMRCSYLDVLPAFCRNEFKSISKLIHKEQQNALSDFKEKQIDLIHISGCHTSDQFRYIYTTWKGKFSHQSVIIIDHFNMIDNGRDLQNIWDELGIKNKFIFWHAQGLAIIAPNINDEHPMNHFFSGVSNTNNAVNLRNFYSEMGANFYSHKKNIQLSQMTIENKKKDTKIADLSQEINLLKSSLSWRIIQPLRKLSRRIYKVIQLPNLIFKKKIKKYPGNKLTSDVPNEINAMVYPDLETLKIYETKAKIAVILHIYFPDIWNELCAVISNISEPFDLFVSLTKNTSEYLIIDIIKKFPQAIVNIFPNHGRDVLPFILYANTGVFNQYDVILKLHTKKSAHVSHGDLWRTRTYYALAGNAEVIKKIVHAMRSDRHIGLVGAPNSICDAKFWHGSEQKAKELAARIGCFFNADSIHFTGSTMFWIHPAVIRLIQSLSLSPQDFEQEVGQIGNTMAHHVERLIGILCEWGADKGLYEVQHLLGRAEVTIPSM